MPIKTVTDREAGTAVAYNWGLHVRCPDGWVSIGKLQTESMKKQLSIKNALTALRMPRGFKGKFLPPPEAV